MAQTKHRPSPSRAAGKRRLSKHTKTQAYRVLIHPADPDETGYWVEVPALPGCFTQGATVEECLANVREAIEGYLESLVKLGEPIPEEPEREDAVVSKVRVNLPVPA